MTRKDDEELVVGAILHKIVVPHPVVIDLEAIEVDKSPTNSIKITKKTYFS